MVASEEDIQFAIVSVGQYNSLRYLEIDYRPEVVDSIKYFGNGPFEMKVYFHIVLVIGASNHTINR